MQRKTENFKICIFQSNFTFQNMKINIQIYFGFLPDVWPFIDIGLFGMWSTDRLLQYAQQLISLTGRWFIIHVIEELAHGPRIICTAWACYLRNGNWPAYLGFGKFIFAHSPTPGISLSALPYLLPSFAVYLAHFWVNLNILEAKKCVSIAFLSKLKPLDVQILDLYHFPQCNILVTLNLCPWLTIVVSLFSNNRV